MRLPALALFALTATLPAIASAQATLNKCIDTDGQVTYSNLPCRNAREARKVAIDPAPRPDPAQAAPARVEPAKPAISQVKPGPSKPASLHLDTRRTTGTPAARVPARQCDALTDKLGRVFDKMDQARRKGYTQEQMDAWNLEVKDLERQKQQSGCF
ncbi:MAG: DUF4124 domain-containing protein [Thiobacillus sp.]